MGRPERHERHEESSSLREAVLAAAWPDVVSALETHPEGFKKHALQEASRQAFERAMETLRGAFGTPETFQEAMRDGSVPLPERAERTHLFHFAARWKAHEESRRRIEEENGGTQRDLGTIMVSHGTRGGTLLTQEEEAKRRENRKRRKGKE